MIYELRQYTLHPGQRDTLIELFEREFVESQEAVGMRLVGTFRDLDDPDRFVWVRGFPDMESRRQALTDFYTGPVWRASSKEANATMIDTDDVLLLRPILDFPAASPLPGGLITVQIGSLPTPPVPAGVVAALETLDVENTFPALPVRSGEELYVWFRRGDSPEATLRLAPTDRSFLR
jgi:NIPSNAP